MGIVNRGTRIQTQSRRITVDDVIGELGGRRNYNERREAFRSGAPWALDDPVKAYVDAYNAKGGRLNLEGLALYMGCSKKTITNYIQLGLLPSIRRSKWGGRQRWGGLYYAVLDWYRRADSAAVKHRG